MITARSHTKAEPIGARDYETVIDLTQWRIRRRNKAFVRVVSGSRYDCDDTATRGKLLRMPASEHTMTPEEFRTALAGIFGNHGWQTVFSRGSGLAYSTVQRYLTSDLPIPQHVAVLVQSLAALHGAGQPLPAAFAQRRDGRRRREGG